MIIEAASGSARARYAAPPNHCGRSDHGGQGQQYPLLQPKTRIVLWIEADPFERPAYLPNHGDRAYGERGPTREVQWPAPSALSSVS